MKPILKFTPCILFIGILINHSCQKELSCENCGANPSGSINISPIANAGPDKTIILPTDSVTLDGSASSDPDGNINEWAWIKISGPASANIINAAAPITVVKNLVAGIYQFELKVKDNKWVFAKDTVQVIVDDPNTNQPPVANAGPDQTITLPTNTVNLDGSGSIDPDNNITRYVWVKISGPSSFNIANANAAQTQITNLVQGVYHFELKVTDAGALFSKDTVLVMVNDPTANQPPIANAGIDQTISLPVNTVNLNGGGSTDPDNNIVAYAWIKVSGPSSYTITNPNAVQTQVTSLVQGVYHFELKVTDAGSLFSKDTLQVIVFSPCGANRPLVNAQLIPIGTIPQSRSGFGFAAAGNKIVFAGGSANSQQGCATARVDIYDISTAAWTTAQLSQARQDMGVAVQGNKIFFAGGIVPLPGPPGDCYITNWGNTRSAVIDIYDASFNSWSTAQLSIARWPTGASAGNKVVFAGGDDDYIPPAIDIYNSGSNSWSTSSLSETRHIFQPAVAGNKIFFGGGSIGLYTVSGGNLSKRIDIYDAAADTWTVDSLSMLRGEMGAISANNKIYWGGGFVFDPATNDWNITNSVEIRDLVTNTTSFDCLSEANAKLTAVRKDNKIIFFGGVYFGISNTRFDIYDLTSNSWSIGVLPQNILGAYIISYNNILYVAGGYINGVWSNQVWKLEF